MNIFLSNTFNFAFCIVEIIFDMFILVFGILKIKGLKSIVLCLRVLSLLFDCVRY